MPPWRRDSCSPWPPALPRPPPRGADAGGYTTHLHDNGDYCVWLDVFYVQNGHGDWPATPWVKYSG
ncbi:hypothetical protein CFP65_1270 [Kitasatospora sp. MMS16-BH015]|uniref:hypothetical protein n=1 Tax=Kitasatospora sp. MMS16-BH015 TaxID=2018025 RepID=UPI000CA23BB2|nr:hypothetical protein [Kitasatospora sp. MMS16-BH015]AUG76171.1 hypothetical protein CFP65_1270 [Kitasatospora sp. MMS16-BH015]